MITWELSLLYQLDNSLFHIKLLGPFRLSAKDGTDLTPKGKKTCALIAILALSPEQQRSRAVLQDKLWSDRGPEQGSASLRQALAEIRRNLGRHRDCLVTNSRNVGLAPGSFRIDIDHADLKSVSQQNDRPILLEDIDVNDPEFEHWLRDQRNTFNDKLDSAGSQLEPNVLDSRFGLERKEIVQAPIVSQNSSNDQKLNHVITSASKVFEPWVHIVSPCQSLTDNARFLATMMGGRIAAELKQRDGVNSYDERNPSSLGIKVKIDVLTMPRQIGIHVVLQSADDNVILWSGSSSILSDNTLIMDSSELRLLMNQTCEAIRQHLYHLAQPIDRGIRYVRLQDAIRAMLSLRPEQLDRAENLLSSMYEEGRSGMVLALLAHCQTFRIGENQNCDAYSVRESANEWARRALEADPTNSSVLALCSHVFSFVLKDQHFGHELAERSVQIDHGNVLGLTFLSRAKCYFGEYEEGYRLAAEARRVAGPTPFNYSVNFFASVASLLTGRFDEAIHLAECAVSEAPSFRPALRYLPPLHLHNGDRNKARRVFDTLQQLEPGFSLDELRDKSYPSAGIRESGILSFSDKDLF